HARAQQGDDQMHRRGRFARAALLVSQNDDVRLPADDRSEVDGHAFLIQTAVSWKTAPPLGGPASALVSALTPIPSSKALLGQMLSTTTTPGCSPSKSRAWIRMEPRRLPMRSRSPSATARRPASAGWIITVG